MYAGTNPLVFWILLPFYLNVSGDAEGAIRVEWLKIYSAIIRQRILGNAHIEKSALEEANPNRIASQSIIKDKRVLEAWNSDHKMVSRHGITSQG